MTIFNPRRVAIAAVAVAWIGTITINSYTDGLELPPLGAFPADIGVSGNAISRMPDPMGDTPILVVAPSAMMPLYAEVARYSATYVGDGFGTRPVPLQCIQWSSGGESGVQAAVLSPRPRWFPEPWQWVHSIVS